MEHTLIIKPGIPPGERHDLEDYLKAKGHKVTGGGQFISGEQTDITFIYHEDDK